MRDAILAFYPDLITTYGDTAAVLGADWYDMLRDVPPSAASFRAVTAQPPATAQAEASARWALGPLFTEAPSPDSALAFLNGSTQRLVLQPGRDTIWNSAIADPVRTAWARVPSGPTTCRWCVMLAARGADYTDAAAAGEMNKFHDDCDCVQIPVRSDADLPDGHDIGEFQRLYAEHSGVGRDVPAE